MGEKSLQDRLMDDKEFAEKLRETSDLKVRQELLKAEGYPDVKTARDFVRRLLDDADFLKAFTEQKTLDEKINFALQENYFFTEDDFSREQEQLAEEEFETLAGADAGAIVGGCWDLQCFIDLNRQSSCPSHFKCTWG